MARRPFLVWAAFVLHRCAAWLEQGRVVTLQVPIDDLYLETALVLARLDASFSWEWQKRQTVAHLLKAFPARAADHGVVIETIHHRKAAL